LWIDLNDDTNFEPGEKFVDDLFCEFSYTTYSSTVSIPVTANPGRHRIRVRAVYNETNFDPCDEYMYGETHDYTVNILSGGSLSVDLGYDRNVCYGIPITISANVTGGTSPYDYLWSTGETTPTIVVSPVSDTIYSVLVTDVIGYSAIDEVEIYTKQNPEAMASSNSPVCEGSNMMLNGQGNYFGMTENRCISNCELPAYCVSKAESIEGGIIEEVIFGDINNNTIGACGNYSDFLYQKTTVSLDDTLDLNVTLNDCDPAKPTNKGGKAFIDWNRDGDFKDNNELVGIFEFTTQEGYYDTTVIVPSNAVLGKTVLRIVCREAPILDSIQACGIYWFGETEDYIIEVIETIDNSIDFYSWTGPNAYSSAEQNPVIPSSVPGNSGTYTLTVTDGNGCTASDNTDVTVMAEPTAYAGEDAVINEGDNYSLSEAMATNYISIEWSTVGTGYFDDPNILDPVYFPGTGETGIIEMVLKAYAYSPCGDVSDTMNLEILPGGDFDLDIKVYLEGTYNGANMNTDLNSILPTSQPYGDPPWNYSGTESVENIPSDVVDWVLIELRDAPDAVSATPVTMIAQQAAFLLDDGKIIGTDGTDARPCVSTSVTNNLFVVIYHRNHLCIMSANPLTESGGVYTYDFTTPAGQAYGTDAQKDLGSEIYGLYSGNGNADGTINTDDKTIWTTQAGEEGYKSADFDMDGQVNNPDKNDYWLDNQTKQSQVPD